MYSHPKPTRDEKDGTFPAYAWPGGYPMFYVTADNSVLCPACANKENGSEAFVSGDPQPDDGCPDDKQWKMVACDVNYENTSLYCDHCNARIDSAYGDEESPEEQERLNQEKVSETDG